MMLLPKNRIVIVAWNVEKSKNWEDLYLPILRRGYDMHFVLMNKNKGMPWERFLRKNGATVHFIPYNSLKNDGLRTIQFLYDLFKRLNPSLIHAHLRDAVWLSVPIANLLRVPVITTRHYGIFNWKTYYAYKIDSITYSMANINIAVSKLVKDIMVSEGIPQSSIIVINNAVKVEDYSDVEPSLIEAVRRKYNIYGFPIIGVVGRYIRLKGHYYVIQAFKTILEKYPHAKLVLANASGPDSNIIKKHLKSLPNYSYVEIVFENNITALYKTFDVLVHVPIGKFWEAYGQVVVEALAARLPVVCTRAGIVTDRRFVDKHNVIIVPFKNSKAIYNSVVRIIENPTLKHKLINNGYKLVKEIADIDVAVQKHLSLYNTFTEA